VIEGSVVASSEAINIHDAYQDDRFNSSIDKLAGYVARVILCSPSFDPMNNVIGCTQKSNKKSSTLLMKLALN
jgi:hypothetical protein